MKNKHAHSALLEQLGSSTRVACMVSAQSRIPVFPQNVVGWRKRGVSWRFRPAIAALLKSKNLMFPEDFLRPSNDAELAAMRDAELLGASFPPITAESWSPTLIESEHPGAALPTPTILPHADNGPVMPSSNIPSLDLPRGAETPVAHREDAYTQGFTAGCAFFEWSSNPFQQSDDPLSDFAQWNEGYTDAQF